MSGMMLNIAGGSFGEPLPTVIGQAYGGGFYAGQIGVSSVATHYLIVGPSASAQNSSKNFKTSNTGGDPTDLINGPANSTAMNDASHPAAQFCEGLSIGGYTDWYMPAKNELEICYYNLKPTATNNNTSSGINANAVPARASNYTAGTPARTSATNFQTSGIEYFVNGPYWSSTENSSSTAWLQYFQYTYSGFQNYVSKNNPYRVRAVRRVAAV